MLSCVQLFMTPWTVAHQAPLSMRFSRKEYWRGLPCPPSEDRPDPEIKARSPALAGGFFPTEPPGKPAETYTEARQYEHTDTQGGGRVKTGEGMEWCI